MYSLLYSMLYTTNPHQELKQVEFVANGPRRRPRTATQIRYKYYDQDLNAVLLVVVQSYVYTSSEASETIRLAYSLLCTA